MQVINEEFQKGHAKVEVLEELMTYLNETEKEDLGLVAEIRSKFDNVEESFKRLHSTVIQRQTRLQNIIMQGQDLQLSLSEAEDQLKEFEQNIAEHQPISAKYQVVQKQKEDHEVGLFKCILLEPVFLDLSCYFCFFELGHIQTWFIECQLIPTMRRSHTSLL